MKYYTRTITKRETINKYGKLGYVSYDEYVKTNDITPFNKGKKIRFTEIKRPAILLHAKANEVIEVKHELSSSEAYFRKSLRR